MAHDDTGLRADCQWMLGIDTSTEWAGLVLGDGRSRMFARSWDAGRTQTTSVLSAIDDLLTAAGIAPSDLDAVAVAVGPGTFTGLRVGMSLAKGFVLARDIPLIGISTLAISAGGVEEASDMVVVLPAGRGRVVWQRFGISGEIDPHNSTVPELVDALAGTPDALVVGELPAEHRDTIGKVHGNVRWQDRDPIILLNLARERWRAGQIDDPVLLEPRYLHGVTVATGPVQDRLRRK